MNSNTLWLDLINHMINTEVIIFPQKLKFADIVKKKKNTTLYKIWDYQLLGLP